MLKRQLAKSVVVDLQRKNVPIKLSIIFHCTQIGHRKVENVFCC